MISPYMQREKVEKGVEIEGKGGMRRAIKSQTHKQINE